MLVDSNYPGGGDYDYFFCLELQYGQDVNQALTELKSEALLHVPSFMILRKEVVITLFVLVFPI